MKIEELNTRIGEIQTAIVALREATLAEARRAEDIRSVPPYLQKVRRTIELEMAINQAAHRLNLLEVVMLADPNVDDSERLFAGIASEVAAIETDLRDAKS